MDTKVNKPKIILRRKEVLERIGLSNTTIYERIKDGTFPKPIRIGTSRAVGWIESEIDDWLDRQILDRE